MKHFVLFYEGGPDYVSRRAAYRSDHLRHAWAAHDRGDLVLGGAWAGAADGAMLLFAGESARVAEDFARNDPYVTNGVVARWFVREWNTVVGASAASPLRP